MMRGTMKKVRAGYDISADDFVVAWTKASTVEEVSAELGMPVAICHKRASFYRLQGVPLKTLRSGGKGGRPPTDVERLRQLVAKTAADLESAEAPSPRPATRNERAQERNRLSLDGLNTLLSRFAGNK